MPDLATALTDAYAALGAIGPPVRLSGDPEPEPKPAAIIVLALVADTSRQLYGGRVTDTRIQTTAYAETALDAATLERQCVNALEAGGWRHLQTRLAPDPDSIGLLSEFTT